MKLFYSVGTCQAGFFLQKSSYKMRARNVPAFYSGQGSISCCIPPFPSAPPPSLQSVFYNTIQLG